MRKESPTRKRAIGLLLAAAVSLVAAQPAAAKDKDPDVNVATDTTANITPSGSTATYAGQVTARPSPRGKGKKEKKRRRKAANRCEGERIINVWHGPEGTGFLIGKTKTDELGRWSLIGNKPPTGDTVTIVVLDEFNRKDVICNGVEVTRQAP